MKTHISLGIILLAGVCHAGPDVFDFLGNNGILVAFTSYHQTNINMACTADGVGNTALGGASEFNGSQLTSLNADNVSSGTLASNRLPAAVSFSSVSGGAFIGNGAGLTNTFNGGTNSTITINATGVTNTTTKYGTAMLTATSATFTIFDGQTNSLITETSLTGTYDIPLGPNARITAASGLTGKLIFP